MLRKCKNHAHGKAYDHHAYYITYTWISTIILLLSCALACSLLLVLILYKDLYLCEWY